MHLQRVHCIAYKQLIDVPYRYTVTCQMVAGHSFHASLTLTVKTGCSTAVTGGMTEQHPTAVLPIHQSIMT